MLPHYATAVRIGKATDNSQIAMKFSTRRGFPVIVSMPPILAKEAIDAIRAVLKGFGSKARSRKN